MDPIETIKPAKDSTLAILLAAQARGWQLFYAEQKDLWLRDGICLGPPRAAAGVRRSRDTGLRAGRRTTPNSAISM